MNNTKWEKPTITLGQWKIIHFTTTSKTHQYPRLEVFIIDNSIPRFLFYLYQKGIESLTIVVFKDLSAVSLPNFANSSARYGTITALLIANEKIGTLPVIGILRYVEDYLQLELKV
jgi:hypothetical protein